MRAALVVVLLAQLAVVKTPFVGSAVILPVDLDGDRATREWIANGQTPEEPDTYGLINILALRHGRVCASGWVDPRPVTAEPVTCWIAAVGVGEGLVCQSATRYWERPLAVPGC